MNYYEDYAFKVTATGRDLLAALLATGKGLEITRVAVGSGRVEADQELADMTGLVEYVAEGAISQRKHEGDNLELTVQYASNMTPGLGMFYLAEFVVEAKHPVTGESVNLLYATLGKYIQPVRAYSDKTAPDIREYNLTIAVSSEIEVTVSAIGGLVTYDELNEAVDTAVKEATKDVGGIVKTIQFSMDASAWQDSRAGKYPYFADIVDSDVTASLVPQVALDEESLDIAGSFKMCKTAQTYAGRVRFRAKKLPTQTINGTLYLIGKATGSGGGGAPYELPPATESTLGGVIIGPGVKVDANGKVSVDTTGLADEVTTKVVEDATAPDADVETMLDEVFGPDDSPSEGN